MHKLFWRLLVCATLCLTACQQNTAPAASTPDASDVIDDTTSDDLTRTPSLDTSQEVSPEDLIQQDAPEDLPNQEDIPNQDLTTQDITPDTPEDLPEDITTDTASDLIIEDLVEDPTEDLEDLEDPEDLEDFEDTEENEDTEDEDTPEDLQEEEDISPEPDHNLILPLGETLFLDGDDYLAHLPPGRQNTPRLLRTPTGSQATLQGQGWRLTPDMEGIWWIAHGDDITQIEVRNDTLSPETFLNYNYTPLAPLVAQGEDSLWVALPSSNAVQRVQLLPEGPQAQPLLPVGSWPTAIALWEEGDTLLISQTGRDSLGWLSLSQNKLIDALPVGDEPASIIVDPEETQPGCPCAYVALSAENRVLKIDLRQRTILQSVNVGPDPRQMALDRTRGKLYVASMLSGSPTPQGRLQPLPLPDDQQPDIAIINTDTFSLHGSINAVGATLRQLWLSPNADRLLVTHSQAHNTGEGIDAEAEPHTWHLSEIRLDTNQDPPQVTRQINLDDQPTSTGPAPDPFSISMHPETGELYITLSSSQEILVLDPDDFSEQRRIPTGHGPRGLVLTGERAWTLAWLDNQLQGVALEGNQPRQDLTVGRDPTPEDVLAGQRIFHDARFSRHGDFACASCHLDGLSDGLVWNILLDGDVNTLAFRNVATTGPFLWGGQLPTLFDFSREVLRLVGADATGVQMEKLTTYMQSVTAPPNPYTLPGGRFSPQALRGKALFESSTLDGGAGCAPCHSGPTLTTQQQVIGKTPEFTTDIPSLISVYDTGPWGRQGQWTTMEAITQAALDFTDANLSPEETQAVQRYLLELPGDLLYLNSVSPLAGDTHAWHQQPVALTFSSNLIAGQESHFLITSGDGQTVPGAWSIHGSQARFAPQDQFLSPGTAYRIRVQEGLRGALGRITHQPLQVEFATGAGATVDVSGAWTWILRGFIEGNAQISFLQSRGGRVSGVFLGATAPIDFDNVQGYVSQNTLVIDPFILLIEGFGDVLVNNVTVEFEDLDGDGLADRGEGQIQSLITLQVEAVRIP